MRLFSAFTPGLFLLQGGVVGVGGTGPPEDRLPPPWVIYTELVILCPSVSLLGHIVLEETETC